MRNLILFSSQARSLATVLWKMIASVSLYVTLTRIRAFERWSDLSTAEALIARRVIRKYIWVEEVTNGG